MYDTLNVFLRKGRPYQTFSRKGRPNLFYSKKGGQWSSFSRKGRPKGPVASAWPIISQVMRIINATSYPDWRRQIDIVDDVVNHPIETICGMTCSKVDTGRPNPRCPNSEQQTINNATFPTYTWHPTLQPGLASLFVKKFGMASPFVKKFGMASSFVKTPN